MTTKYPRPCEGCERLMRPQSPTSHLRYPDTEVVHQGKGFCKACAARKRTGRTHLIGKPIRRYRDHGAMMLEPITFGMLMRIGELHPPTAKYITDRRLRGVPAEGLRKRAA